MSSILRVVAVAVLAAFSGCAGQPTHPLATAALPNDVHWYRVAAEQRALYIEVYRSAQQAARTASAGLPARSWGVILDLDETVLDNSEYERRLAVAGQSFTDRTWNTWVAERAATVLPGARQFIDAVLDELHGRIVFITNRSQSQCADTEANLRQLGLRYDLILCDAIGDGNKNPRFRAVGAGTAGIAAVNVLLWVGDNIQDFPDLDQQHAGDAALFGNRYFVLPNPMYGSWQKVPVR